MYEAAMADRNATAETKTQRAIRETIDAQKKQAEKEVAEKQDTTGKRKTPAVEKPASPQAFGLLTPTSRQETQLKQKSIMEATIRKLKKHK